jgi:hypothetical protein
MLVALCFHDLFLYKILFHRKRVRLKSVSYLLFDALFCFKLLFLTWASFKITKPILMAINKELLGDNPLYFFFLLSLGSFYYCNDLSLSFLFRFCAKNSL